MGQDRQNTLGPPREARNAPQERGIAPAATTQENGMVSDLQALNLLLRRNFARLTFAYTILYIVSMPDANDNCRGCPGDELDSITSSNLQLGKKKIIHKIKRK